MIKFLHTADLHLGSSFSSSALSGKKSRQRRQELLDTFKRIIAYGEKEKVNLILIAGDLFEHNYADKELIRFISGVLESVSPIPVFISPGNHDPVVKDSYYLSCEWPENVYIFLKEEWERVELEANIDVYGLGWQGRNINEHLLQGLKIEDKDKLNIICVHADMLSSSDNSYLPIDKDTLSLIGGDYYALGHIHQREEIKLNEKIRALYPGSPEPLDINETGRHGFYIGEIDKNRLRLQFIDYACRENIKGIVRLSDDDTYDIIRTKIYDYINKKPENIYRIILEGEVNPELKLNLDLLKEELIDKVFHIEIIDNSLPIYDLKGLKSLHKSNAIGLFISLMEDRIEKSSGDEKEKLKKALFYGIDALSGKKVIIR